MDASSRPGLRAQLATELTAAMRRRDKPALRVLRITLARIGNAEAVPIDQAPAAGAIEASAVGVGAAEAVRRELDEAEVRSLVHAEIAELSEAGLAEDAELLRDIVGRLDG